MFSEYRKLSKCLPKTGGNDVQYISYYTDENYHFKTVNVVTMEVLVNLTLK